MSLSPKQEQLFKQASKHIPGGVNSPVRAFNGVGERRSLLKSCRCLSLGRR